MLAAAQTVPVRGDVACNLAQHARLAQVAAEAGARVLVFPELSLTGYELDLAAALAFAEGDARLDPLRALASARSLTLVVGAPVRTATGLHIGAFILAPDGSRALYTKHHLGAFPASINPGGPVPPAEPSVFQPGTRNPLVPWTGGTGAVAVCADTGRPDHARRAAERGADTYLVSMFFTPGERAAEWRKLAAIAKRHRLRVALANFGGPTGGLPAAGGSAIWSAAGERLTQLDEEGPGVVLASETAARALRC